MQFGFLQFSYNQTSSKLSTIQFSRKAHRRGVSRRRKNKFCHNIYIRPTNSLVSLMFFPSAWLRPATKNFQKKTWVLENAILPLFTAKAPLQNFFFSDFAIYVVGLHLCWELITVFLYISPSYYVVRFLCPWVKFSVQKPENSNPDRKFCRLTPGPMSQAITSEPSLFPNRWKSGPISLHGPIGYPLHTFGQLPGWSCQ